jgi:hypothetical protein
MKSDLNVGFTAITGFTLISFGHPDSLDAFPVSQSHEIANRSIAGNKLLRDLWKTYLDSASVELVAKFFGKGGNFISFRNLIGVHCLIDLPPAIAGLGCFFYELRKFLKLKA